MVVERVSFLFYTLEYDVIVGSAKRVERSLSHSISLFSEHFDIACYFPLGQDIAFVEKIGKENDGEGKDVREHHQDISDNVLRLLNERIIIIF